MLDLPLLELGGTPYHCYNNVPEPVLAGDNKKITKSGDMLDTPKLPHGYAREVPCAPPDAHQGNAK